MKTHAARAPCQNCGSRLFLTLKSGVGHCFKCAAREPQCGEGLVCDHVPLVVRTLRKVFPSLHAYIRWLNESNFELAEKVGALNGRKLAALMKNRD